MGGWLGSRSAIAGHLLFALASRDRLALDVSRSARFQRCWSFFLRRYVEEPPVSAATRAPRGRKRQTGRRCGRSSRATSLKITLLASLLGTGAQGRLLRGDDMASDVFCGLIAD